MSPIGRKVPVLELVLHHRLAFSPLPTPHSSLGRAPTFGGRLRSLLRSPTAAASFLGFRYRRLCRELDALTYFRERHQKQQEQGEVWDFREAILDLRDRYLYKSTPLIAARKFKTLMQGERGVQALYDDLTTQAARMVEYPSDYHFRLRFMLALRPGVLEHIIRTHSVSAEQSTLVQIRSACEDYERSNEYGKQLAATQSRLGGSKATRLLPDESVTPNVDDSPFGLPEDCEWNPRRGPRGPLTLPSYVPTSSATASASSASMESTANPSVPTTSEDTKISDSGVTTASASSVTSQSATI